MQNKESSAAFQPISRKPEVPVDLFADFNLDTFGLLLPERFNGTGTQAVADGISKILEFFSFPSLNVVFSAAGQLVRFTDTNLVLRGLLEELEIRLVLRPLDKDGRELPTEALSILGLEPSETEVRTEIEGGGGNTAVDLRQKPNISAIFDTLARQLPGTNDRACGPGASGFAPGVGEVIAAVASAAAQGLQLAFGGQRVEKPKVARRITQLASLAGPHEFAWYLRSFGEVKKDGVHHGAAFLQVSREVATIEVSAVLKSDWLRQEKIANFPNQILEITKQIPVYHAPVPTTPILTDFTSASAIPIVVPRSDVAKLLLIDETELEELIQAGRLVAFGQGKRHITKGSLVSLLGLEA